MRILMPINGSACVAAAHVVPIFADRRSSDRSNASATLVVSGETYTATQPCHEQCDADERLMSVTFHSRVMQCPESVGNNWLVAPDGPKHALHALAVAMRPSTESGARMLDLVNVRAWLSKEAAEAELPKHGWAVAAEACARLDARKPGWRSHVLMGDPAADIGAQTKSLGSRGIVIGARGGSAAASLLLGTVAQQVIHAAGGGARSAS